MQFWILDNQNKLQFNVVEHNIPETIQAYVFSKSALWFWALVGTSLVSTMVFFTVDINSPFVLLRYILGLVFILLLPGFSFLKTLFRATEISGLERITLSIGISIAISPLVGLVLNYSPWGVTLESVSIVLVLVTLILAVVGLFREYEFNNRRT